MTTRRFQVNAKQAFLSTLIASQLLPLVAPPVMAAEENVQIAGHVVIVNKSGGAEQSIDEHTAAIQENLDNALVAAQDHSPSSVKVIRQKGVPIITLGGYKIVTVDSTNAKLAKTTALPLAYRWAAAMRSALSHSSDVDNYIAQLNGTDTSADGPQVAPPRGGSQTTVAAAPPPPMAGNVQQNVSMNPYGANAQYQTQVQPPRQNVMFAPAGTTFPITLSTSISSAAAQAGDVIQASLAQDMNLGNGVIPAGAVLQGVVTDAEPGRRLDRSGSLSIKFTSLQLPDGSQAPIVAHLVGNIGKYADKGGDSSDTMRGESMKNKLESAALRGAVGAGTGAALGTAVGAIADHGHGEGLGRGAWSGAAIGGGIGVADSLLLRKAADVVLKSGTNMQLQLDQPLQIACPPNQMQ